MLKRLFSAWIALASVLTGVRGAGTESNALSNVLTVRAVEIDNRYLLAGTQVAPAMLDALGHRTLHSFLSGSGVVGGPSDLAAWRQLRDKYEEFGGSISKEPPPIALKALVTPTQQQNVPRSLPVQVEIENTSGRPIRLEGARTIPNAPFLVVINIVYKGQSADGTSFSFEETVWYTFAAGTVLQIGEKLTNGPESRARPFRLGTRTASYFPAALISFNDGKKVQLVVAQKQVASYAHDWQPQTETPK